MTTRKRRQRTARKLVLPLVAVALMATMMFMESASRRSHTTSAPATTLRMSATVRPAAAAAARVSHDLRHR